MYERRYFIRTLAFYGSAVRGSDEVTAAAMIEDSVGQVPRCGIHLSASDAASSRSESTINWTVNLSKSQVYTPVSRHSRMSCYSYII